MNYEITLLLFYIVCRRRHIIKAKDAKKNGLISYIFLRNYDLNTFWSSEARETIFSSFKNFLLYQDITNMFLNMKQKSGLFQSRKISLLKKLYLKLQFS